MRGDVQTQVGWLRGAAERRVASLSPSGRPVLAQVRVEAGLMRGVLESYQTRELTLGSAPDCDVVLMDDGVHPHHLTLRLVRSPFGVLAEVLAEAPATVGGVDVGPGSEPATQRLPVTVRLGGAELTLSGQSESLPEYADPVKNGRGRAFGGLAVLCVILALVLAAPLLQQATQADPTTRLVLASAGVPTTSAAAGDFQALVTGELTRLGIAGDLLLNMEDPNATRISGRISASKWDDWRSFATWYDQQPAAPVLIQSVVQAAELTMVRPVVMVRLTEPPRIHLTEGQTVGVGDELQEGWIIDSISADGLVLSRGDDRTEISF